MESTDLANAHRIHLAAAATIAIGDIGYPIRVHGATYDTTSTTTTSATHLRYGSGVLYRTAHAIVSLLVEYCVFAS